MATGVITAAETKASIADTAAKTTKSKIPETGWVLMIASAEVRNHSKPE